MMTTKLMTGAMALLLVATACAPKRIEERPIYAMGDQIPDSDVDVAVAVADADGPRRETEARRDAIMTAAVNGCRPAICDAVARGEVMLGMTELQVMAATRTTEGAWRARRSGTTTSVLSPRWTEDPPRDVVGGIVLVQMRNGVVASYTYRESHGLRVVDAAADATVEARTSAMADGLIREADALVAAGNLQAALDRYDRASILKPHDALLEYRIATILDQSLRPVEALMRYQRFLHQMELEKIEATGDANAKLADAIARARERVIVLERRR